MKTPKILKAAIYARYSGRNQTEQSIEGQLRVCREYALREKIIVPDELVYIDRALTGKTDARPAFQRMIGDGKKGLFDVILVYKLDRFSRDKVHSAVYKHELGKHGVAVRSATENISDTPEGGLMESIIEAFAQFYSAELSQKTKRGMRESAEKGQVIGGPVPFGYFKSGKKLAVNEEEAVTIRYAFSRYAGGATQQAIVGELYAQGRRQRDGSPIETSTLYGWYRQKKYVGVMEYPTLGHAAEAPSIVDKATFEKVQAMLEKRKRGGGSGKAKVPYLLTGKIWCGACGSHMYGNTTTSKKPGKNRTYSYYVCYGRHRVKAVREHCTTRKVGKEAMERLVLDTTAGHLLDGPLIERIADGVMGSLALRGDGGGKAKLMQKERKKLEKQALQCVDAMLLASSALAIGKLEEKLAETETRIAEIDAGLLEISLAETSLPTKQEIVGWLTAMKNDGSDAAILNDLVKCAYVYNDKTIIYYNMHARHAKMDAANILDGVVEPQR